jgi:hypothetical protein
LINKGVLYGTSAVPIVQGKHYQGGLTIYKYGSFEWKIMSICMSWVMAGNMQIDLFLTFMDFVLEVLGPS